MANNQLPPCMFSTTECLQWWAFTRVERHPLQEFGPEIGGICPRVGLYPELYGRREYQQHFFRQSSVVQTKHNTANMLVKKLPY